jgi:D-tyrosyl-tRNA(Tyr) deacylase
MRVVIQRVSEAKVVSDGILTGSIGMGLVVLLGIELKDAEADVDWLVRKIAAMRILSDEAGKMNLSVKDIAGEVLVISQFTLFASTKKGNRPGFTGAAGPEHAVPLYESFLRKLSVELGQAIASGVFGADMKVSLVNDGPVTIVMDSHQPE